MDRPNERSSHALPTPRGLGIAVVPVVIAGWMIVGWVVPGAPVDLPIVCLVAFLLAILSWVDDVRRLPVVPRLLAQIVAVAAGVWTFGNPGPFDSFGMPSVVASCATGILWLGFINQTNFMDGIDGHLGTMLTSLGIGLFLVSLMAGTTFIGALSLVLAGTAGGFLLWNWHPARGFLGDVGSVPVGYLVAWLLLRAASQGLWIPVVILPLFYLVDTAVTYSRRLARGGAFWRPHREYLYQRAAQSMNHSAIVRSILPCNVILTAAAMLAVRHSAVIALSISALAVGTTYVYLEWRSPREPRPSRTEPT